MNNNISLNNMFGALSGKPAQAEKLDPKEVSSGSVLSEIESAGVNLNMSKIGKSLRTAQYRGSEVDAPVADDEMIESDGLGEDLGTEGFDMPFHKKHKPSVENEEKEIEDIIEELEDVVTEVEDKQTREQLMDLVQDLEVACGIERKEKAPKAKFPKKEVESEEEEKGEDDEKPRLSRL